MLLRDCPFGEGGRLSFTLDNNKKDKNCSIIGGLSFGSFAENKRSRSVIIKGDAMSFVRVTYLKRKTIFTI